MEYRIEWEPQMERPSFDRVKQFFRDGSLANCQTVSAITLWLYFGQSRLIDCRSGSYRVVYQRVFAYR